MPEVPTGSRFGPRFSGGRFRRHHLRVVLAAALNREWQQFSGQVANFDDVLNSQQLVRDPTTGIYYEAPYSSYDPNGPNGPGYYSSDGHLLNPVTRP